MNETEIFYPASLAAWRKWLQKNHRSKQAVWLVLYNKRSGKKSISWSDAVDVALCFGWIDSKKIKIDADTAHQFFSRRKPGSTWSKINKEKAGRLSEAGLMTEAGYESIRVAKENGSWSALDTVEALIIPDDLELELNKLPGAKECFSSMSRSAKKMMLYSLLAAKRPETREKRIHDILEKVRAKMKRK